MEKDDINTFGRSEFFGDVYPVAVLGDISSIGGLDTKCTSLRQRILEIGLIGFSWDCQKILLNQLIKIFLLTNFSSEDPAYPHYEKFGGFGLLTR